uniref:Uncharacterized protein n=2 Tax=Timema TaxID=61471 RepID=A0A7R9B257_TIMSH|nr:unnamed protein product [Timema shepardi]CAD7575441.1 unnamed protein product [Timema californicum]
MWEYNRGQLLEFSMFIKDLPTVLQGDKNKRDTAGPNEIVTCTNCGPNPCTHSANNGCATEIRSVIHRGQPTLRVSSALQGRKDKNVSSQQVRKKEPPHPIRVAKTIDVIARITFPCAYAVFLIFFFIHYNI